MGLWIIRTIYSSLNCPDNRVSAVKAFNCLLQHTDIQVVFLSWVLHVKSSQGKRPRRFKWPGDFYGFYCMKLVGELPFCKTPTAVRVNTKEAP